MISFFRILVGFFLIPLCFSLGKVLFAVSFKTYDFILFFLPGMFISFAFVLIKGRIGRGYIFFHEINHALWSCLSGIPVKKISLNRYGGNVEVERQTVIAALAPYFFSIPSFLIVCAHALLYFSGVNYHFINYAEYVFLGFFQGWHAITSFHIMLKGQVEIYQVGIVFSVVVITALFFFWSALFITVISRKFCLADFFSLSYKETIDSYYFCLKILFNLLKKMINL